MPIMVFGQLEKSQSNAISSFSLWSPLFENIESIDKVELEDGKLFVYRTIYPNSNDSCAVYHPDGKCSWSEPRKVRDVYEDKNGNIVFVGTESPKYKTILKEVETLVETWE
ncbi:hypothetical protein DX873_17690 [Flagellimonas nanhaiensis]|uniref:Uncharacterized protein n=2 Tax=Flagellimonas nanhaiensis TaxID=2292706 RepID=A0A371JLD8_9FLAO|nr:hypothetical protein DX873_17690 [Allomuricauda nanhaiensis]